MSSDDADFIFKISVIGEGQVGKTSLIQRYTQATFQSAYTKTIGAQFSTFIDSLNDLRCKLTIWDIAGQDDHFFLRPAFYKGTTCGIIVFSLEDSEHGKESFKRITNWYKDIKKYCGDLPIVLFGNKVDLIDVNELDEDRIQKTINKEKLIGFYKTSAKDGQGVIEGFQGIIKYLMDNEEMADVW
jgi:GTP-binding nuclear protein Ran